MTPVPRITCGICPGLLPPFFHPRIKLRARIAHGGGRRPGHEANPVYNISLVPRPFLRGEEKTYTVGACALFPANPCTFAHYRYI